MAAMRSVRADSRRPSHAHVHAEPQRYLIELDLPDFAEDELTVVTQGSRLSIRGDQQRSPADVAKPFRFHECFEESFQLPQDADASRVKVFWKHGTLELQVPRNRLEFRRLPIEHSHFAINPNAEPC